MSNKNKNNIINGKPGNAGAFDSPMKEKNNRMCKSTEGKVVIDFLLHNVELVASTIKQNVNITVLEQKEKQIIYIKQRVLENKEKKEVEENNKNLSQNKKSNNNCNISL